eukprot:385651-Alexandrium_andersonii.AAC.1
MSMCMQYLQLLIAQPCTALAAPRSCELCVLALRRSGSRDCAPRRFGNRLRGQRMIITYSTE